MTTDRMDKTTAASTRPMEEAETAPATDLSTADIAGTGDGRGDDAGETGWAGSAASSRPAAGDRTPLFAEDAARDMRSRWDEIQTGFVDEPRQAVERADALVAEAMKSLAQTFARERESLERQWSQGDDVSTEGLRVALQRYRSFFDRLLTL